MLVEEGKQILAVGHLVKKLRMGGCVRVEVSSDVEIVFLVLRCMYLGIALNINSCHVLG
jgi:hypothetical protein